MTSSPVHDDRHGGGPIAARLLRTALALVCGVMLVVMMLLTVIDVLGRYLFNNPLSGATELTELLLAAVIFLGLPAVCLDDENVTVDILSARISSRFQPLRRFAVALVSTATLGVIAWRLWEVAVQIDAYGGMTDTLSIPVAPVAALAAVGTGLSAIVTLAIGARVLAP